METIPEQSERKSEIRELRMHGEVIGTEETILGPEDRLEEEIWRDAKGEITSHVRYIRNGSGRIVFEEWNAKETDDHGARKGRYVWEYDDEGIFSGKWWEDAA